MTITQSSAPTTGFGAGGPAADDMPAMVWRTDSSHCLEYLNREAGAFLGEAALGQTWSDFLHPDDFAVHRATIKRRIHDRRRLSLDVRLRRMDGSWHWVDLRLQPMLTVDGEFDGVLCMSLDVTIGRRAGEAGRAMHDKLTGLPSRPIVERLIERSIEDAAIDGLGVAVLAFGFDRFQMVNEVFGHEAGDQLLREVGRRLQEQFWSGLVGTVSGNRFILIGEPALGAGSADNALSLVSMLSETPFRIPGAAHDFSLSVGIARYPEDGTAADELLMAAESALQTAKTAGGDGAAFSDPRQQAQAKEQFDLEQELRLAIARDELVLYFQPKVSLRSRRLIGFEALVRWQHPERGLLLPDKFIALAEQANLMRPLTQWAFHAAGLQTRAWIEAGLKPVPIAVNASPRVFLDSLMLEHLPAYHAHNLPRGLLEVEITESTMIHDFVEVSEVVEKLKPFGIKVAIDDFGTGYSSLAGLNKLPVATLKIDQSFTRDLNEDASSRAVAACIISIARELGLKVVAEGVETEAQLKVLRGMRCHVVQGYLTGRPMPGSDAALLLELAKPARRRTRARPRVAFPLVGSAVLEPL